MKPALRHVLEILWMRTSPDLLDGEADDFGSAHESCGEVHAYQIHSAVWGLLHVSGGHILLGAEGVRRRVRNPRSCHLLRVGGYSPLPYPKYGSLYFPPPPHPRASPHICVGLVACFLLECVRCLLFWCPTRARARHACAWGLVCKQGGVLKAFFNAFM